MKLTRREALIAVGVAGASAAIGGPQLLAAAADASAGRLNPHHIPKFVTQLYVLPAMPAAAITRKYDHYSLAARHFTQQILPKGFPRTPVFGFGSPAHRGSFHAPSRTIEARADHQTRLTWANELVTASGHFVPPLMPVDPTLHWANPPGGIKERDGIPAFTKTPPAYTGPVPIVVHLHGAHDYEDSDGYPEAWYLPVAKNIPKGYATVGTFYDQYKKQARQRAGAHWTDGNAVYVFANDQRATSLWFHDHTLGMARVNVRAGLLGLYNLRGGSSDLPAGHLPGPAPRRGDRPGTRHYEIPLVIQDPSFNANGTQYLPPRNLSWDGPYIPHTDIPPIWNGMYLGETITVNGNTWPNLHVEPRRYRFRILNGCPVRALGLKIVSHPNAASGAHASLPIWVIGSDGGFLPFPVELAGKTALPILPSERYDIIIDFTGIKPGTHLYLNNEGVNATHGTTSNVMRFTVVPLKSRDKSIPPRHLALPPIPPMNPVTHTRKVSFSEQMSGYQVNVIANYLCGTVNSQGLPHALGWDDPITEKPKHGGTEIWEIYNFSPEGAASVSHVFHMHLVQFQVINREPIAGGAVQGPHPWEYGPKDSCASPTGYITRVQAHFDHRGLFVWHCHFFDHEDNTMMRPYRVV